MKKSVIILCVSHLICISAMTQSYTNFMTGNPADVVVSIQPSYVLAGGGTDNDDAMRWMLSRAKGGDVLVLRASGSNGYNNYFFNELGVNVHSVETILFKNRSASSDSYVLDRIRNAEIIFIAGGDQTRYFDYWSGTETGELLKNICKNRTKIVGGTSAGMMILGNLVYTPIGPGVTSTEALGNPYHPNLHNIEYNTFMETAIFENTIFDTHFDDRSRDGRLLVFLAKAAFEKNIRARAIACNESTVVCIDENNKAIVFGDTPKYPEYAYFLEVNCEDDWKPVSLTDGMNVDWSASNANAVISQRIKGDKTGFAKFDLNTWKAIEDSDDQYWQINHGVVQKIPAKNIECTLIPSSNDDSYNHKTFVFPNPSDSIVYFPKAEFVELITIDGIKLHSGKNICQIDVSFCKPGEYVLKMRIDGVTKSHILIKK